MNDDRYMGKQHIMQQNKELINMSIYIIIICYYNDDTGKI